MRQITTRVKHTVLHLKNDSLYRNSIYLILSTAVMSFFGFIYWMLCTRIFNPDQVGIGTTLISITSLIVSFSLLGLGNGLIKYLPVSNRKNENIYTAVTLVGSVSIVFSLIFLLFINIFAPSLVFVRNNPLFSAFFILSTVFYGLIVLADDIFTAYRSTLFVLIKNTVFSATKLVLPVFLIGLGAYGIYLSFGIASFAAFLVCIFFLYTQFSYRHKIKIHSDIVKEMARFSLGNYAANFISSFPNMILPVIITNFIGPRFSAYFYMDLMIANLLYIIPISICQALFAEGSYSIMDIKTHLHKAIKMILIILIPAIILLMILGKYLLMVFGLEYSLNGSLLLYIFAVSSIFISINYLGDAILKLNHRIKLMVGIKTVGTLSIIVLSFYFKNLGLPGIGIAWLGGNIFSASLYFFYRIFY